MYSDIKDVHCKARNEDRQECSGGYNFFLYIYAVDAYEELIIQLRMIATSESKLTGRIIFP